MRKGGTFGLIYVIGLANLTIAGTSVILRPSSFDSGEFSEQWSGVPIPLFASCSSMLRKFSLGAYQVTTACTLQEKRVRAVLIDGSSSSRACAAVPSSAARCPPADAPQTPI